MVGTPTPINESDIGTIVLYDGDEEVRILTFSEDMVMAKVRRCWLPPFVFCTWVGSGSLRRIFQPKKYPDPPK